MSDGQKPHLVMIGPSSDPELTCIVCRRPGVELEIRVPASAKGRVVDGASTWSGLHLVCAYRTPHVTCRTCGHQNIDFHQRAGP